MTDMLKDLRHGHELVHAAITLVVVAQRTLGAPGADPGEALKTVRENLAEIDRWLDDQEEQAWKALAGRNGRTRSRKAATA